jgi:hypothetical protein
MVMVLLVGVDGGNLPGGVTRQAGAGRYTCGCAKGTDDVVGVGTREYGMPHLYHIVVLKRRMSG